MNIITVLPNYYLNQMIAPRIIYQQSIPKVSPLLSILSQALKTSIISYEKALLSQNQIQYKTKNNKSQIPVHKQLHYRPQTPIEEMRQKTNDNFKRENNETKQAISKENQQKPVKYSSQDLTNDSKEQEQIENKQEKKTRQLSRRIKKDKNRRKKGFNSLKMENINLLQCAHIPKLGINAQDLKNRKESLLQRMFVFWDQKFKNIKDRREIRMLNF